MTTWDGNKLIKAREDREWSRADLVFAWYNRFDLRLTVQTIHNWEVINRPPGRDNLLKLAGIFEKPVEYFFTKAPATRKPVQKPPKKRRWLF